MLYYNIGTHVCTDVPGEFEWRAGPLAQVLPFPFVTMQQQCLCDFDTTPPPPVYWHLLSFMVWMMGLSGNDGGPMGSD